VWDDALCRGVVRLGLVVVLGPGGHPCVCGKDMGALTSGGRKANLKIHEEKSERTCGVHAWFIIRDVSEQGTASAHCDGDGLPAH